MPGASRQGAAIWLAALAMWPAAAIAQETGFDAALEYAARDELETNDGEEIDNDFLRLTTALNWSAGDGRARGALELGLRNEDFNGETLFTGGLEFVFARRVGRQRYGLGGRVRTAEELSTTTELGYAIEHLGNSFDLRGLAGLQLVGDSDEVPGRSDDAGVFGLGELTIYPGDNLALSGGVFGDADGTVFNVGAEYRPGTTPLSFFVEYAEAFDEYRDFAGYDNLSAGIRIVPGASSVREQRQGGLARVLRRPVEVQ